MRKQDKRLCVFDAELGGQCLKDQCGPVLYGLQEENWMKNFSVSSFKSIRKEFFVIAIYPATVGRTRTRIEKQMKELQNK